MPLNLNRIGLESEPEIAEHLGLAAIVGSIYAGADSQLLQQDIAKQLNSNIDAPGAWLDLSILRQALSDSENARVFQEHALALARIFRIPSALTTSLKLLVFKMAGDFMINTPVEFMVEGSSIEIIVVYVNEQDIDSFVLPSHDVAILAISESPQARTLLNKLKPHIDRIPSLVFNKNIEKILQLDRALLWKLLSDISEISCPRTEILDCEELKGGVLNSLSVEPHLQSFSPPMIVRPEGAHAGKNTLLLTSDVELQRILTCEQNCRLNLSEFVDYSSSDGQFRKYRIAMIDGRPYPAHMAISSNWMVHYLNAGMDQSAVKRDEERRWLESFETDFAPKHKVAFNKLDCLIGLDYFVMDCAETQDGRLLIFEIDTAMIVHCMDVAPQFAYKCEPMEKLFSAFRAMISRFNEFSMGNATRLANGEASL